MLLNDALQNVKKWESYMSKRTISRLAQGCLVWYHDEQTNNLTHFNFNIPV